MPAKKSTPKAKPVEVEAIVPSAEPVPPVPAPEPPAPVAPYAPPQLPPAGEGKPGMVQAVAIMTLVNGILNILWGAAATMSMFIGIVTICLIPFTILPLVLGIFEIIYAAKLLSSPPQPVRASQAIAIMEICCILVGNVISLVVGILALVFYNNENVRAYFVKTNTVI